MTSSFLFGVVPAHNCCGFASMANSVTFNVGKAVRLTEVPIDLNGTCCTALTKVSYQNLRNYLRFPPDTEPHISSRVMGSVRALEDLLLHYEMDTRPIYLRPPLVSKTREMPDHSYYDDFKVFE